MRIVTLIALIFLSLVPAGAYTDVKGPCGGFNCNPFVGYSIDVTMERDFPEEGDSAVPFAAFNVSSELNGWHDVYDLQVRLAKSSAVYATLRPARLNDDYWSLLGPTGQACILIGLLLLVGGTLVWSDRQLDKQIEIDKARDV